MFHLLILIVIGLNPTVTQTAFGAHGGFHLDQIEALSEQYGMQTLIEVVFML